MKLQHLPLAALFVFSPALVVAEAQAGRSPQLIAQAELYGVVTASDLNVRDGAGTDRDILYVLHQGAAVRITGQYGDGADSWYRIIPMSDHYPQTEGWVDGTYLSVSQSPPADFYYSEGYQDGVADAQAGQTYDPFAGSHDLAASDSRVYTRGYADGYEAGRPDGSSDLQQYYDDGYVHGEEDAQAGRTYDPVAGSHNLPSTASREYTRGYADGYEAGRP